MNIDENQNTYETEKYDTSATQTTVEKHFTESSSTLFCYAKHTATDENVNKRINL